MGERQYVNHYTNTFGRHALPEPMVTRSTSDARCYLHVDRERQVFYVEFHEDSSPWVINGLRAIGASHDLMVDDGGDDYDALVDLGVGVLRQYLVPCDPTPAIPTPRRVMPDLSLTAYGPFSGEMPVVVVEHT